MPGVIVDDASMLDHSLVFDYFWAAPAFLQLLLAALLYRHKLQLQYPWFFAHAVFVGVTDLLLFYFYKAKWVDNTLYSYSDSTQVLCLAILRFGVIYEIFTSVSKAYPTLKNVGDALFRWGTVVLVLLAVAFAFFTGASPFGARIIMAFHLIRRTVNVVQCGLLLTLLLLASYLKLSWRSYSFGIAVGMGINSAVRLLEATVRTQIAHYTLTPSQEAVGVVLNFATMAVYHLCVLLWIGYLFLPQPQAQRVEVIQPTDLESWNAELERLVQR